MRQNNYLFLVLLFVSFVYTFSVHAQEPPIKWGEIPRADLEMKNCPSDSNASAIILCDYGESYFGDELEIIFTRHIRVKILTTKGYEKGTVVARLHTGDGLERITDIEGVTYNLNDKGEIISTQLRSKDIYKDEVSENVTKYRFTMPALAPGSVFELRYKIQAAPFYWSYLRGWNFQWDEPVRWSEYRMRYPRKIGYSIIKLGYERFAVDETADTNQFFSGGTSVSYFKGMNIVPCIQYRWAIKDAPAIRDEPYMTTVDDYINRIDIQLSGYVDWAGVIEYHLTTWEKLAEELQKDGNFYRSIKDTRRITKLAEGLTAGLQNPIDKMKAIYNWLSKSIVCTGDGMYAVDDLDDILEAKKGRVPDITFLFLSMLKSIGMEGSPVLLSTRDNGMIQESYPIVSQFNYVIAKVKVADTTYLVDPSDVLRPWDLLSSRVLGVRGFVVNEKSFEWINVSSPKKYTYNAVANVTLDENGGIKGSIDNSLLDYAALNIRKKLNKSKDIDVIKENFDADINGLTIDSSLVEGKDSVEQRIRLMAWISSSAYAQASGDMIYINPHIMYRFKENPFKKKTRKFPVDYPFLYNQTMVYNIQIPDSFEVKDNLPGHVYSFRGDMLSYSVHSQVDGKHIQILCKFQINTPAVKESSYEQLRDFYNLVVTSQSEQIVLQKIHPAPPPQEVKPVESKPEIQPTSPQVDKTKTAKKKSKK
jgi:hypothetical protein